MNNIQEKIYKVEFTSINGEFGYFYTIDQSTKLTESEINLFRGITKTCYLHNEEGPAFFMTENKGEEQLKLYYLYDNEIDSEETWKKNVQKLRDERFKDKFNEMIKD